MKRLVVLLSIILVACGAEDTPGRRVEGMLSFVNDGARSWASASGWSVTLDEAVVLLGPVYLRPPKREAGGLASLLVSRAHAHAQTLKDGDVMGEYLSQLAFDALGPEQVGDALASEAGQVDRLSIVLDAPRGADSLARAHGYHAYVRGSATRGSDRVEFACGLRIDAAAQEMPKNLEARRRIDNVKVTGSSEMDEGVHLRVHLHSDRWFDFVSFDDFVGPENPCAAEGSAFALQWYLGLRRPEAFSAELN
jgi:hypothetical protein